MIAEILKEIGTAKAKDEKEFSKELSTYLKGDKLEEKIASFWKERETVRAAIAKKYPNVIQQLTFYYLLLHDLNSITKKSFDESKNKAELKYRMNASIKLYNKSLHIFTDIFGLLENGHVMNTFLLWKPIYENYIATKYINGNGTEEEAKLLLEYEAIQKNKILGNRPTKEERAKIIAKFGRDFETNDYCWSKNIRGKKSFLKLVRNVKEKRYYKHYILASYIGQTHSFSIDKTIIYNDKIPHNQLTVGSVDEATKSLTVFFAIMIEYANLMIDKFVDDKKQKEQLKKVVTHFGKTIDKKWKK